MDNNNLVAEFHVSASEYCKMLEYISEYDKNSFFSTAQKILSLVYLKASLLPKPEDFTDEELEKFVQEEDWIYVKNNVANVIGNADELIEISVPDGLDPDNTEDMRLSDAFADIYQDLKDFVEIYEISKSENIKYAVYECIENFEQLWGQKLISILTFIHNYLYNKNMQDDSTYADTSQNDTSNWLINQKFNV